MFAHLNYRSIYYIYTDHLGSYCAITSASKRVVQRNYFDAWGNYKLVIKGNRGTSPPGNEPQVGTGLPVTFGLTDRGFTGHEHYPYFRIINMNGRLYDPVIGRFFSPDKYVANSSFTQDFNRYSYARNCPLMYTDPSGEFAWIIPIAYAVIMGAYQGYRIGQANGATGWDAVAYTAAGGFIGGFAAGMGTAVGVGIAMGGCFLACAVTGGISGLASGSINGLCMGALSGGNIWKSTWQGGVTGAAMGAFIGGMAGGVEATDHKGNFWTGKGRVDFLSLGSVEGSSETFEKLADAYNNNPVSETNDEYILCPHMESYFNYEAGKYNLEYITTKTGKAGLTPDGYYVLDGKKIEGYRITLRGWPNFEQSIHISPAATGYDIVNFKEVAGHELVHAYHRFYYPNMPSKITEAIAYQYSYNTYIQNGYLNEALIISQHGIIPQHSKFSLYQYPFYYYHNP